MTDLEKLLSRFIAQNCYFNGSYVTSSWIEETNLLDNRLHARAPFSDDERAQITKIVQEGAE